MKQLYNPYGRIDVPTLLGKLGIRAREASSGRKFTAPCPRPEHNDKSPSWFIHNKPGEPFHAAFSCLGCGFKGGPIKLAAEVKGITEEEAKAWLEDMAAPPPVPVEVEVDIMVCRPRPSMFKLPPCFNFWELEDWPDKHQEHMKKKRGFGRKQAVRWQLGFIGKECECENKRHANRIAIPVISQSRIEGYTCRSVTDHPAKYVEPRTEEGANKTAILGSHLFGKHEVLFVVEGPFDAIAVDSCLQDIGVGCVAALRGSNTKPVVLARFSMFKRIVVMTDPDKAGLKAREAIEAGCSAHTQVVCLDLPEGEDPSSLFYKEGRGDARRADLFRLIDRGIK